MAISNPRLKTPEISETWSESLHRRPRVPCLSNSTPLRSSMSTSESPEARSAPLACSMPTGFGSSNTGVSLRCISSKWAVASAFLYYEYSTVVVGNGSVLLEPSSSSLKKITLLPLPSQQQPHHRMDHLQYPVYLMPVAQSQQILQCLYANLTWLTRAKLPQAALHPDPGSAVYKNK
ncbi:hypothetical protein ACFX14_029487 [Malus domestica]